MRKLAAFLCGAMMLFGLFGIADASSILLDSTTINFSASGNAGTSGGSWNATPLYVDDGATIDYFTVEITEIDTTFDGETINSLPQAVSFDSYVPQNSCSLTFCDNPSSCFANTDVGVVRVIELLEGGTGWWSGYEFMTRLVAGNDPQISNGHVTISYRSDYADSITTYGKVSVKVYGEPAPVPVPGAGWLLGSGLFGLVGLRGWLRKSFL